MTVFRIVTRLTLGLFLFVSLVLLGLVLLLGTQTGARWVLERGVQMAAIDAGAQSIKGSIWHGLHLSAAHYEDAYVQVQAEQLSLTPLWRELMQGTIRFSALQAESLSVTLKPSATIDETPTAPSLPVLNITLPFAIVVDALEVMRFTLYTAQADPPALIVDHIQAQALWDDAGIQIGHLNVAADAIELALSGTVKPAYPYALDLELNWLSQLPTAVRDALVADTATGTLHLQGDMRHLLLSHAVHSPLLIKGEGHIYDPVEDLRWQLSHQWGRILWLLADEPVNMLSVAPGSLTTQGNLDAYTLALDTHLQVTDWPGVTIALKGQGSMQQLDLTRFDLTSDAGIFALHGRLAWQPELTWDIAVSGEHIDPGILQEQIPGMLSLALDSTGRIDSTGQLSTTLDLKRLQGEIRSWPVKATAHASLEQEQLVLQQVALQVGTNNLELNGRVGLADLVADPMQLAFHLNAPELSALWPDLAGNMQARGNITGTLKEPVVDITAQGDTLSYADYALRALSLQLQGSAHTPQGFALGVDVLDIEAGAGVLIEQLTLKGDGTQHRHTLTLDVKSTQGQLAMALAGGLDEALSWRGQLTQMQMAQEQAGHWQLDAPAALNVAADGLMLDRMCLLQLPARLCMRSEFSAKADAVADVELVNVDLNRLQPWLPDDMEINGALDATANLLSLSPLKAALRVQLTPGTLSVPITEQADVLTLAFTDTYLDVTLEEERVEATLAADFLQQGSVRANLHATAATIGGYDLDGQIEATLPDVQWLQAFIPAIDDLSGRLQADLRIQGSSQTPQIIGNLQFLDGALQVPDAGIEIREIALLMSTEQAETLLIRASMHAHEGRLELNGQMELKPEAGFPLTLAIEGEKFVLVQRPDIFVSASPKLQLVLRDNRLHISGDVLIPKAHLELIDLPPQAVRVSADEVIIDEEMDAEGLPLAIEARVRVILGDEVTLKGYGLQARLAGDVRIEELPERPTRVTGEIQIQDGRYQSYGQDLRVAQGRLMFQGSVDNPGLDLRAERHIPVHEVTAGLEVGGTLREPRSRVYSIPVMEDSDAIAYLLTGRPLSGTSANEGNMLVDAIALYGIERGAFITESLATQLGLDELSIDADGGLEQTALLLGKQLTPKLYLRYTVGLIEQGTTLLLRYSLSQSLSLETRSAHEAQSMDLIYRKER